jgi:predicted short-subunit dehydrogenase-like oxidoreductase (DUF2520 family)
MSTPPPEALPTLNIIGGGRVGKTLGKLWNDAGLLQMQDVLCRSMESAQTATDLIGAGTPITEWSNLRPAAIHLLSVPDDAAQEAVATLAEHVDLQGSIVFHTSGWMASNILQQAQNKGAATASVHPIKGFADPALAASTFAGTPCGVEGNARALDALMPLFEKIGGKVFTIDAAQKPLYHVATIIGCNYMVALTSLAQQSLVAAGIDETQAMDILVPLLQGTVDNLQKLGPVKALTGPISRGDASSVQAHLDALQAWNPQVAETYADLAAHTIDIAAAQGTPTDQLTTIRAVLEN